MGKTNKVNKAKENKSFKGNKPINSKDFGNKPIVKNDPQWYYITENIGKAGASLPFNRFLGQREDLGINGSTIYLNSYQGSIPGILALEYAPSVGYSDSSTSAINTAARATYSFVRHANSGHANYEAMDLMIYLLAMDDIYRQLGEIKRCYAACVTYSAGNRYLGAALSHACGATDYEQVIKSLADYRYRINVLAAKISQLYVPQGFYIYNRHALISKAVFKDTDSERSQFWMFTSRGYYKYDSTAATGGRLVYTEQSTTLSGRLDNLESCLDVILQDEDMNIMSGDILKAYGKERCHGTSEIDENVTVEFIYNKDINYQMKHATIIENLSNLNIEQAGAGTYLTHKPTFTQPSGNWGNVPYATGSRYLNSYKDVPEWKDTIEWTRCMLGFAPTTTEGSFEVHGGTELITKAVIYALGYYAASGVDLPVIKQYPITNTMSVFNGGTTIDIGTNFGWLDAFKVTQFVDAPLLYGFIVSSNDANFVGVVGELSLHTIVDQATLVRLNDLAIMGLFTDGSVLNMRG